MSIIGSNILAGASGQAAAGGYQVSRSLRFNSSDSAFCSRTPASSSNRKTWTWAGWVKRSVIGQQALFHAGSGNQTVLWFDGNVLEWTYYAGGYNARLTTTAVYRDFSAWMHVVFALDTTQATANSRMRLYVNGVEVTTFTNRTNPSLNDEYDVNSTVAHQIGVNSVAGGYYFNGYLAECYLIDGQQLTPSSFTEVSATTGQLIPIEYTGTFGTNGFHLPFSDNSAATAATLGADTSGNGNNWTPNNFQATVQTGRLYAQASGTSTSAFSSATLLGNFPATVGGSYAIYDADLITSTTSATFSYTHVFSAAVEVLVSADGTSWTSKGNQSSAYTTVTNASAFRYVRWFYSTFNFGINNNPAGNDSLVDTPTSNGTDTGVGNEVRGNYATFNPLNSSATLTNGNLNIPSSTLAWKSASSSIFVSSGKWYVEYTWNSGAYSLIGLVTAAWSSSSSMDVGPSGSYYQLRLHEGDSQSPSGNGASFAVFSPGNVAGLAINMDTSTLTLYKNGVSLGSIFTNLYTDRPLCVAASAYNGNGDINFGQRAFAYTAPSGFKALVDTNLGDPLVAKPNTLMDVVKYDGNGSTQTISGLNFSPDLVWLKARSAAFQHGLFDVVRGTGKGLVSNTTGAELTFDAVTSFNSDGFTNGADYNGSSTTYVGWAWKGIGNSATPSVSNPDGSITSQVRANVSAGFSVVGWTSNGASGIETTGHGLGVSPDLIIVKNRDSGSDPWQVFHSSFSNTASDYLFLNTTDAKATSGATIWTRSSTTFGYRQSSIFTNGQKGIAYCFAAVVGYSSFGSYVGNGSSDGPMVWTGMRPRWILLKASSATGAWILHDTARTTYNVMGNELRPDDSTAEYAVDRFDLLSNGFKVRSSNATLNTSSATYIYIAFAENPFQYARAR